MYLYVCVCKYIKEDKKCILTLFYLLTITVKIIYFTCEIRKITTKLIFSLENYLRNCCAYYYTKKYIFILRSSLGRKCEKKKEKSHTLNSYFEFVFKDAK